MAFKSVMCKAEQKQEIYCHIFVRTYSLLVQWTTLGS